MELENVFDTNFLMRWNNAEKKSPKKEGYYLALNSYEDHPKVYWWGISPISSDNTKRKWRTHKEGAECWTIVLWSELPSVKKGFDWDKFALKLKNKFGESVVTDIVWFIKNYH